MLFVFIIRSTIAQHTLDGCHLKYVLENYLVRESLHMYWRAVFYSLFQFMSTTLSHIELILIDDLRKINTYNAFIFKFYEKSEFSTELYSTMKKSIKRLNILPRGEKTIA